MRSNLNNRRFSKQLGTGAALLLAAAGTALAGDIQPVLFPDLDVEVDLSQVSAGVEFGLIATVTNNGTGTANSPSVELSVPVGYNILGSANKPGPSIPAGQSIEIEFRIDASCTTGIHSLNAVARNGVVDHDTDQTFFFSTVETLADNAVASSDAPEKTYQFDYQAADWWVAGVNPGSSNQNLVLRDSACGNIRATSFYNGSTTDFVLVNGNALGADTTTLQVVGGDWGDSFDVELDRAADVGTGEHAGSLNGTDFIDLLEFPTTVGTRYRIEAAPGPLLDITLATVDAGRAYASRGNADTRSSDGGIGDTEVVEFYGHNGRTAIVVAKDGFVGQPYSLSITPVCFCDMVGDDGTVNILDLLAYLDLWFIDDLDADTNSSGSISIIDLLEYLDCWLTASQQGCF